MQYTSGSSPTMYANVYQEYTNTKYIIYGIINHFKCTTYSMQSLCVTPINDGHMQMILELTYLQRGIGFKWTSNN
jgi:hypothetical protein